MNAVFCGQFIYMSKPGKTINKTFIFKNKTSGFKNKTFSFINKTFIYKTNPLEN